MSLSTRIKEYLPFIQQWTFLEFDEIIFDSKSDNWSVNNSVFDLYLQNRKNVVIFIQTPTCVIGGYVKEIIDKMKWKEFNVSKGESIADKNAFLFTFLNGNSFSFPIVKEMHEKAFTLYRKDSPLLFDFGNSDIVVTKSDYKQRNFCAKNAYNYLNGYKEIDILEESGKENPFDVEQIVVVQMKQRIVVENEEERKRETSQLENWTGLRYTGLLFDSRYDKWSMGDSLFDSCVFGKQNIAIIIDDMMDNRFGVYLTSKIDQYQYQEFGEWKGTSIADSHAFMFSLKSNGRLNGMTKFNVKLTDREFAFILYKRDSPMLFCIGGNDASIKKEEYRTKCFCKQSSYNYGGKRNVMVGNEGSENPFTVDRIRVLQFGKTLENEMKEKDMKTIEDWTGLKTQKLIFDSNIDKWDINTSEFDKKIMYRNKLIIMIESENDDLFGVYIDAKITTYKWKEDDEWKGSSITDPKCFVFTLFSNGRIAATKFEMIKGCETKAFTLFKKDFSLLFTVGDNDIAVFKENNKMKCVCRQNAFNYLGFEGLLVGREGTFDTLEFV